MTRTYTRTWLWGTLSYTVTRTGNKVDENFRIHGWVHVFAALLAALFVTLQLTGVIAWSWWMVLSPLWVMLILWVIMVVTFFAYVLIRNNREEG